jgi:hypothetical protein
VQSDATPKPLACAAGLFAEFDNMPWRNLIIAGIRFRPIWWYRLPRESVREKQLINALLLLALTPARASSTLHHLPAVPGDLRMTEFLELANSHHVLVRALQALQPVADTETRAWIDTALQDECERIRHALEYLENICRALEAAECPVTVIKSLDHWPDLGTDLDLFTTAPERDVVRVFERDIQANAEPRSWGDRLAKKWNFKVPGLPESVEIHCERAGQTGEHVALARRIFTRRVTRPFGGRTFMVTAPEERVIVSSLQRMYRHFYFRACDIVDTAQLIDSGTINYDELRRASMMGGIWPGVATFLKIVSDYTQRYRGTPSRLPEEVIRAARFGGEKLTLQRRFLRVPILPEAVHLYTTEIAAAAKRGDVPAAFRLSLLPPLASAAAVAFKMTGTDKGIW